MQVAEPGRRETLTPRTGVDVAGRPEDTAGGRTAPRQTRRDILKWGLFGSLLLLLGGQTVAYDTLSRTSVGGTVALLFGIAIVATNRWASPDPDAPGSSPSQPLDVSLIRLIAAPEEFDGQFVRVQGFARIEHEGTALYLHREDAEHMLARNGLWLSANDGVGPGSDESRIKDRHALIEARFVASRHGHRGLWSGSLEEISRMGPWETDESGR